MAETALWLYAVVCAAGEEAVDGLVGVAGAPVRVIALDDLAAAASPVPLAEYDEAALKRNLEDLDWLGATARAHDTVVFALTGATTAVPVRLATVYRDEAGVRAMLAERAPRLRDALTLLAGRTEWGVKAFADPGLLAEQAVDTGAGDDGPGTAYLRRRREQLSARDRAQQLATAHADRLHETFVAVAVAARRHPPQDRTLSGERGWMVLNGAYLVDHARRGEIADTVRRVSDELPGVRIELTGPWSPYSFAGFDR